MSILISIKPEWAAKILNGEKTIEIRKTAPKRELPIDVYIYCAKSNKRRWHLQERHDHSTDETLGHSTTYYAYTEVGEVMTPRLDGKIVAKFTLDKIDEVRVDEHMLRDSAWEYVLSGSRLSREELRAYAGGFHPYYGVVYAWHISDLEIFDKPKDLSEFKYEKKKVRLTKKYHWKTERLGLVSVKKAPKSWQYVEERE